MASHPMQGVRVVEVAQYTFVPAAGAVLAEWGAEVIKVEHAERGDAQRGLFTVGSVSAGGPFAPIMEHPNHNKRSIGLALEVPEGLEILHRLVRDADVFLTNFLPDARSRLHIDVEDMRKVNPRIIYVRGTALGVRGEDRTRPGFDGISYWYRAGSAAGATPPNLEGVVPMPAPAYGDSIGGMTLAGGISAALFARERTGEPSVVDVSLIGVGAWANALAVETSFLSGQPWQSAPMGRYQSVETNPLVGVFQTKDGRWIGLSMLQPGKFWEDFCRHLGRDDLTTDPRFDTTEKVIANAKEAGAVIAAEFKSRPYAEWVERFRTLEGPWEPVQNSLELGQDPQLLANGIVGEVTDVDGRTQRLVAAPVQFDERPAQLRRGPQFAEHTDEILQELGVTESELLELKLAGAVT